jgi:hypothetical protein
MADSVSIAPALASHGYHAKFTALRPTGWTIIDDTATGASVGAFVQGGTGYVSMDIRDIRTSELYTYRLSGAYTEIGLGADEAIKIAAWSRAVSRTITKINHYLRMAKKAGVSSDLDYFSGGSVRPLYRGMDINSPQLEYTDLKDSIWVHAFIGGDLGVSGDIGLIWCLGNGVANVRLTPAGLFGTSPAWGFYGGVSASLGIGIKMMFRMIMITKFEPIPYR